MGELVQYNCTDWDFLLSRAEANGMIVLIDASEISVNKPEVDGASELIVTFGQDLHEFHADINLHNQFAGSKECLLGSFGAERDSIFSWYSEPEQTGEYRLFNACKGTRLKQL